VKKNSSLRTTKLEYLKCHTTVIAIINDNEEIELKPTKDCQKGDIVWILEPNSTFTKTLIC
jgi:hypothetical protein